MTCRGRRHEVSERAGCGKTARPVRRAATGNGAMAWIEAPVSRKPPATATPHVLPPPRQSSTLPDFLLRTPICRFALVWSAPHLQGGAVRASRFSCTLVSGLWRGNLGSRALMESAHASPHLPNGLEWARRELRLLACRSDLSCHQLLFSLATVGELTLARILGHRRAECGRGSAPGQGTQRCPRAVHGRGLLNRPSAGGQAVDIATSRRVLLRERFHTCRACAAPCHGPLTPAERDSPVCA